MRLLALVLALAVGCKDGSRPVKPEVAARNFAQNLAADMVPACDEAKVAERVEMADRATAARLLCQWVQGVTSYTVIGIRTVDGLPHPIMRRLLSDPQSGAMFVAYDELVLGKAKVLKLTDAFSFRQSVSVSELLAANASGAAPTDYLGASSAHPEVLAAQDLLRGGDRDGALKAVDALPPALRKERGVQMLRVRAAVGLGPDAYKQALGELAQTFPDDPAIALIEIDGALDVADFAAALHWIDVLENVIGVDAFIESTRVVALIRKGDLDKALERAEAAVKLEPTLTRALEIKLDVLIARKQWADVLDVMTELETHHGSTFDLNKLRAEPRLAELVTTPLFAQWADEHNQRPQN